MLLGQTYVASFGELFGHRPVMASVWLRALVWRVFLITPLITTEVFLVMFIYQVTKCGCLPQTSLINNTYN